LADQFVWVSGIDETYGSLNIRDCLISQPIRIYVSFPLKLRFLLSQYPPGITRIESQNSTWKIHFNYSGGTY